MATHSRTVQLNNRGVAYLEKGNFSKAFTLFRDALRNTMDQLRDTPPSEEAQALSSTQSQVQAHETGRIWRTKGMEALASSKSSKSERHFSHCDFVFSRGITLMEERGAYSANHVVDATVASSIVLFNLALIHHMKGLNESSSKYLVKAESFYCRSYQMMVDTGLDLGRNGNPVIDFLSMVLLNNAAQVGRELCHSELSQDHFQQLMLVATQVNTASYGEGSSIASFIEEQRTNFLLNAIALRDQNLAPAA